MSKSLYKYVSIDRLTGILIDHKVRFTQPGAFNDPFELVPRLLVPEGTVPQGRHINYRFSLNTPRRPIDIDRSTIKDDGWCHDSHFRDLRKQLDQDIGFLSLSRTWKSLPMWAHYAESFSGAAIEFDGDHEFFEWAFDVQYSHDRPIRDFELYRSESIPIAEMCDKSIEWQYEKEVRLARCLSDCRLSKVENGVPIYLAEIPRECIKRVILGERVSNDNAKEIFDIIQDNDIIGSRAVINHWEYDLELTGFKLGPYKSGGKMISSFMYRFERNFPRL